jgi:hypothetical protein
MVCDETIAKGAPHGVPLSFEGTQGVGTARNLLLYCVACGVYPRPCV